MAGTTSPQDLFKALVAQAQEKQDVVKWSQPDLVPLSFGWDGRGRLAGVQPTIPNVAHELWNAFSLPGDVMMGNVSEEEALARGAAFPFAIGGPGALAGTAKAGVTGAVDENLLNIFAGPRAKTADLGKMSQALDDIQKASTGFFGKQKAISAEDMQSIFAETGWFVGPDGKMRFEIPDNPQPKGNFPDVDAAFKKEFDALVERGYDNPAYAAQLRTPYQYSGPVGNPNNETIGSLIDHPELFAAYPDLANVPARMSGQPLGMREGAHYSFGPGERISASGTSNADIMSVVLHELQHGVQEREGFAVGGNPDETSHFLARIAPGASEQLAFPDPMLLYRALMGETEARTVQSRYELGTAMDEPFTNIPYLPPAGFPVPKTQFDLTASGMYDIPFQHQITPSLLNDLPLDLSMAQFDAGAESRAAQNIAKLKELARIFGPKS